MSEDTGVCARDREIKQIHQFISSRIEARKSGILYITGPPGTGKTMSIQYVLDRFKKVPTININCMKKLSSKSILSEMCHSVKLQKFEKCSESEMIARLAKKFTGRTCETHLIVLDEMDNLPKSKNVDLIRTIFSWPNQENSKLILIGIANTVNLTSRYQTISSIIGRDYHQVTKILFKPYTTQDIKDILNWYLENDENLEDAELEPKALDLIAAKFARTQGDIRGALNALKSTIQDVNREEMAVETSKSEDEKLDETLHYPTPPSTPPLTPCRPSKRLTNIASVASSVKKRQRVTHYPDDLFPYSHQIILTSLLKLCSNEKDSSVKADSFRNLMLESVFKRFAIPSSRNDYNAMLESLEDQGLISSKKYRLTKKIVLKASEQELDSFLQRKDMIMNSINDII